MRFLIISVVVIVVGASGSFAQNYWIPLPTATTRTLYKVAFVDTLNGWAVGDSGTIIRTDNGGQTWSVQETGTVRNIYGLFMLDLQRGWAVAPEVDNEGYETTLLRTSNGGEQWTQLLIPDQLFYAVAFTDSLHGWMVGEFGAIFGTDNGGDTWYEPRIDTTVHPMWELNTVKFFSPNYGYAIGGRFDITGMVWRTTNGGYSWKPTIAGAEPLYGIHAFDSLNILCVGGDFDLGSGSIVSNNGGESWDYHWLQIWGQARGLAFRTASEAWAPLGFVERFMFSSDSGRTWQDFPTPGGASLYDVVFVDSLHGYMVGEAGAILKYNSSPVSVKEHGHSGIPLADRLDQNYPNPFNPSTIISYDLAMEGDVSISVYDVTGRIVRQFSSGKQFAGNHSIVFDGKDLATGVYVYQLLIRNNGGSTTLGRKMLLVR